MVFPWLFHLCRANTVSSCSTSVRPPVRWESGDVDALLMVLIWEKRYPGGQVSSAPAEAVSSLCSWGSPSTAVWAARAHVTPFLPLLTFSTQFQRSQLFLTNILGGEDDLQ